MAGMGVLHLEIATTMLQQQGLEIITSPPIINYRETIRQAAGPIMSRSPNRHNKIFMKVEPLDPDIVELIRKGELNDTTDKKTHREDSSATTAGTRTRRGRSWTIDPKGNMLCEETKGVQFLQESMDSMRSGFEDVMQNGPLAYELCRGVKVTLTHYVPHEDAAHRTYAQLMPATRRAILGRDAPGQPDPPRARPGHRGQGPRRPDRRHHGRHQREEGQAHQHRAARGRSPSSRERSRRPRPSTSAQEMRGATAGRAVWNTYFKLWQPVPTNMLPVLVAADQEAQGPPRGAAEGLRVHRQRVTTAG